MSYSNDPNFPAGPTYGKSVVTTDGSLAGDKQVVGNFFDNKPASGTKLDNFVVLNGGASCTETGVAYYKYSLTAKKGNAAATARYVLIEASAGQPYGAFHDGIAIGKPASDNAVTFSGGNSAADCHSISVGLSFANEAEFCLAAGAVYSGCAAHFDPPSCVIEAWIPIMAAGLLAHPNGADPQISIAAGNASDIWSCGCDPSNNSTCP